MWYRYCINLQEALNSLLEAGTPQEVVDYVSSSPPEIQPLQIAVLKKNYLATIDDLSQIQPPKIYAPSAAQTYLTKDIPDGDFKTWMIIQIKIMERTKIYGDMQDSKFLYSTEYYNLGRMFDEIWDWYRFE